MFKEQIGGSDNNQSRGAARGPSPPPPEDPGLRKALQSRDFFSIVLPRQSSLPLRTPMTKSQLIESLAFKQTHLMQKDVELAVKLVLDHISNALSRGERVEIRGFGSFALHHRPARVGRNPKTGEAVRIPAKSVPHFKPGKEMRERVNALSEAA
jgi:integration host factor subunit beta